MATPLATPATTESSTLYFGPWYRRSPFFEKTLEAGCSAYDIYNHMYLPGYYGDPVDEYWALLEGVTLWDVSVERIVEITGPDASAFTNSLTCRDLTKCAVEGPSQRFAPPVCPGTRASSRSHRLRECGDRDAFATCALRHSDAARCGKHIL